MKSLNTDNYQPDSGSLYIFNPTQSDACISLLMTGSEAKWINERLPCLCGEIRVFNYDWFILTEYIAIALVVFTNCKEAINHANESEPMSANTLVFIRTWGRGDCEAEASWKLGSFHSLERSELLITNQLSEKCRRVIHHRSSCTWTATCTSVLCCTSIMKY